ncbi:MAG: hypothetical protein ACUVRF_11100 [Desulfotomaculales bacterium]
MGVVTRDFEERRVSQIVQECVEKRTEFVGWLKVWAELKDRLSPEDCAALWREVSRALGESVLADMVQIRLSLPPEMRESFDQYMKKDRGFARAIRLAKAAAAGQGLPAASERGSFLKRILKKIKK